MFVIFFKGELFSRSYLTLQVTKERLVWLASQENLEELGLQDLKGLLEPPAYQDLKETK